jgi:hypothetical protein
VSRHSYDTPFIPHRILDSACVLDAELVTHDYKHTQKLLDDMNDCTIDWLTLHYPEYTFGFSKGAGKPRGHLHAISIRGGYRWADWRTT